MTGQLSLDPSGRVLLLSAPDAGAVRLLSEKLAHGLAVVLTTPDEAAVLRRECADCRNVMCHPGTPEEIPFQDGFFTVVIAERCTWTDHRRVATEVVRSLAPEGRAYLRNPEAAPLLAAGLAVDLPVAGFSVFLRPAERTKSK